MAHPLDGARMKLARAREHIDAVRQAEHASIDGHPYGVRINYDPAGGENSVRAIVLGEVSPALSPIIGDALHNLRATLDYIAFELYRLEHPAGDGRHIYFPVCSVPPTDRNYKALFLNRINGITDPPVIAALDGRQPYHFMPPERDLLAVLHDLDIRDKHHALHLAGGAVTAIQLSATWPTEEPKHRYEQIFQGMPLGSADNDAVLFRYPFSAHPLDAAVAIDAIFRIVLRDVWPGRVQACRSAAE